MVEVLDPALQTAITEMRAAGLNIMMSMKDERKPVSFVEDCAVPLVHLAEYTAKLTAAFREIRHPRHLVRARLRRLSACASGAQSEAGEGREAMRAIAEEAFALVRAYKGSHSGEHGDGLVRSEFHERCSAQRLARAFEEVKDRFDPRGLINPGKIVRAPKFDDRETVPVCAAMTRARLRGARLVRLSWRWRPFPGAVEMCNNNGDCRSSPAARCARPTGLPATSAT